jgi:hypothetical protein
MGHADPDVVWAGDRLVAAWTHVLAVEVRTFDAALAPLEPEQVLVPSATAIQSRPSLAPFGPSWAAAFRSGEQGLERIVVQTAGGVSWSTPLAPIGPVDDRPALVELDDAHLLVVFVAGAAIDGSASGPRVLAAFLDMMAPGPVQPFDLASAVSDPALTPTPPSAARVGDRTYVAWQSAGSADAASGDEVVVALVSVDAGAANGLAWDLPLRLPYPDGGGSPSNVHLGASTLFPDGALMSLWETTPPGVAAAGIQLDFRPSPFVFTGDGGDAGD